MSLSAASISIRLRHFGAPDAVSEAHIAAMHDISPAWGQRVKAASCREAFDRLDSRRLSGANDADLPRISPGHASCHYRNDLVAARPARGNFSVSCRQIF